MDATNTVPENVVSIGTAELSQLEFDNENLREALGLLELQLEDQNWTRLSFEAETEFSRDGVRRIIALSRLFYLKNPLIRRAVDLQTSYVFAFGAEIHHAVREFSEVLDAFLDDPGNWSQLGNQGRSAKETSLQVEGNIFFVLFADRSTGFVRVRTLAVSEITEILPNPEDRSEPWFYKRVWQQRSELDETRTEERTAYYPDWRYRPLPGARPTSIKGKPVLWASPVYHVKVGALDDMRFGLPETYPAQDWATAYRKFLEDWATLARAYSRFAHRLTVPAGAGKPGVAAAKARLGTTVGQGTAGTLESNPPPVAGSTFIAANGYDMQPMRIGGANMGAEDGRRLLLMVAAASGWPETFFGDASIGNHATAKTLDRPSELKIKQRQQLWSDIFRDIIGYVFEWAARAPSGPLRGFARQGLDLFGRPILSWEDDPKSGKPYTPYPEVDFPPIVQHDISAMVSAVVSGATLDGKPPAGTLDRRTTVRMLLTLLGDDDIDATMQRMFPPETDDEPDPWSPEAIEAKEEERQREEAEAKRAAGLKLASLNQAQEEETQEAMREVFCATGPGGGIDPTCGNTGSGGDSGDRLDQVQSMSEPERILKYLGTEEWHHVQSLEKDHADATATARRLTDEYRAEANNPAGTADLIALGTRRDRAIEKAEQIANKLIKLYDKAESRHANHIKILKRKTSRT